MSNNNNDNNKPIIDEKHNVLLLSLSIALGLILMFLIIYSREIKLWYLVIEIIVLILSIVTSILAHLSNKSIKKKYDDKYNNLVMRDCLLIFFLYGCIFLILILLLYFL